VNLLLQIRENLIDYTECGRVQERPLLYFIGLPDLIIKHLLYL